MNYAFFELLSAVCTGILFLIVGFKYQTLYVCGMLLYWCSYIIYRYLSNNTIVKIWGLYEPSTIYKSLLYTGIICLGLCIVLYNYISSFYITRNLYISFVLYPLWGIAQQFLLQSMVLSNIIKLYKITNGISLQLLILFLSCIFGYVHKYIPVLIVPTILWGYISSNLYLQFHNIIPIGICQGILATILFYGILRIDVLKDIIQPLKI